jgi:Zn-finger protein
VQQVSGSRHQSSGLSRDGLSQHEEEEEVIVCDFCHAPMPDSESKKSVGIIGTATTMQVHVCKNCVPSLASGIRKLVEDLKQKLQTKKGELK